MPTWRRDLPAENKHMGFDLRRTPATAPLQAIITCEDLLVCDTHFFHGRTQPCERPNCQACNDSIPFRTHVYLSAYDPKKVEHFLYECTAHAAKPLAEYRDANNTLRGCIMYATRPKGTRNGKVVIQTNTANLVKNKLPEPPDVVRALSLIWRLPANAVVAEESTQRTEMDSGKHARKSRRVATRHEPIDRMRQQPDNQPDPMTVGAILSSNGHQRKEPATA